MDGSSSHTEGAIKELLYFFRVTSTPVTYFVDSDRDQVQNGNKILCDRIKKREWVALIRFTSLHLLFVAVSTFLSSRPDVTNRPLLGIVFNYRARAINYNSQVTVAVCADQ